MLQFFKDLLSLFSCLVNLIIILALVGIVIIGINIFLPNFTEPSAQFDCDDSTLETYNHFTNLGIDVIILAGNLEIEKEKYSQCNHVWLLVKISDTYIPYDWGIPYTDQQHYEGFQISYKLLLDAVASDKE